MKGKVKGKVAIVTGAAHGMGRSHCLVLAGEGADIAAVDLVRDQPLSSYPMGTQDEMNSLVKEVEALGRRAMPVRCDVTKSNQVADMLASVVKEFGKVDILVNNVGVCRLEGIAEMTEEQWDFLLAVNVKSQFLCCKYVLPHMIKQRSGKIINIGSVSGRQSNAEGIAYGPAKAAVHAFTHALAKQVADYNINVNCVAPGSVNTPMVQGLRPQIAQGYGVTEDECYANMCKRNHLMGREITEEDVSRAVLFLASEDSRNIDGMVIYVDGGHP